MARFNMASLQKRTVSALILIPIVIALVFYGGWPFAAMVAAALLITVYEWVGLSRRLKRPLFYGALGSVYIIWTYYSFFMLSHIFGAMAIILFMSMVWASDIGAYFAGKFIGGPKLAPKLSPNKTWAGLVGAMVFPALTWLGLSYSLSFFISPTSSIENNIFMFAMAMIFGVICQVGDLLVSNVKRHADVKDTGNLIPGHGGILDRIDAMMLAAPAFYYFLAMMASGV